MHPLKNKVALVAGATRGAGRGIACMLGAAGATVYCTGRSSRANQTIRSPEAGPFDLHGRPETIEETADKVTAFGGQGVAIRTDHTVESDVERLFRQIQNEQGRLDILVNDIWGGDELAEWGKPFWEQSLQKGWLMQERAVRSHILTSHYALPLMLPQKSGLIVEITDGKEATYRGNFFYDLAKASVIRLAVALSAELKEHGLTALAVTPGFLRSEAMLEHFGVTENNWKDGAAKDPHFIASETPFYVGRAVAALAADPKVLDKTGQTLASWDLAVEYGFQDMDGSQPHWDHHLKSVGLA